MFPHVVLYPPLPPFIATFIAPPLALLLRLYTHKLQVEAFVQVDQQYLQQLRQHTELVGESAGTTALAVVVWGNTVYVANAGEDEG